MRYEIRSFDFLKQQLAALSDDPSRPWIDYPCLEWPRGRFKIDKYGQVRVDGRGRLAHRVAYMLSIGPIPSGLFVCHHCDNPPCVRPSHLFLGTHSDNMQDSIRKGRFKNAPKPPRPIKAWRLTDEEVLAIRHRRLRARKHIEQFSSAGINGPRNEQARGPLFADGMGG